MPPLPKTAADYADADPKQPPEVADADDYAARGCRRGRCRRLMKLPEDETAT